MFADVNKMHKNSPLHSSCGEIKKKKYSVIPIIASNTAASTYMKSKANLGLKMNVFKHYILIQF